MSKAMFVRGSVVVKGVLDITGSRSIRFTPIGQTTSFTYSEVEVEHILNVNMYRLPDGGVIFNVLDMPSEILGCESLYEAREIAFSYLGGEDE